MILLHERVAHEGAGHPGAADSPSLRPSVLVTGASGLVGRRVVDLLFAQRTKWKSLLAVDLRDPPAGLRHVGVEYERCDVRDPGLVGVVTRFRPDTVVHLAAVVTPVPRSTREFEYSIDVEGTRNVVEACLAGHVRHLVYTSSGAAYGFHADNPVPLTETDALRGNPGFAYADHKRLVEEMLAGYRESHPELKQLIFRPGTILGASVSSPISAMFERRVVVGVAGSEVPFVLVWDEDVAACIVRGILERKTGIYNVAGDGVITLREIARRLGKPYVAVPPSLLRAGLAALHAVGLSTHGAEGVDFLLYRPVLSNESLKKDFGFTPSTSSEDCFERFVAARFPAKAAARRAGRPHFA